MLPPAAALRVPLSNPSAITMPGPWGWSKCTWLSIPPGKTRRPEASISEAGARQIVRERDDTAVFHANVAFADVSGGDDRSAANDQIKLHSHHLRFQTA